MLNPLHPSSHNNLQLGEGVLMRCADLDALLENFANMGLLEK